VTEPRPLDRRRRERLLDWRSGGWVLVAGAAVAAVALVLILRSRDAPHGASRVPFDTAPSRVPVERITDTGLGRDGIPALDAPAVMPGAGVASWNEAHRGKYLVSGDRVIGVWIQGAARAYPLRVLAWHEVVNDVLASVPIAVTYHPLSDAIVVLDRRVDGETLELGTSGLLYESTSLLYDRHADPVASSLWSPLRAEAVAGPAAARRATLAVLPASVVRWGEWLAFHPDTTVLRPDERFVERYERDPYGNYLKTRTLRFPVAAFPPPGALRPWSPILVTLDPLEPGGASVHSLAADAAVSGEVAGAPGIEILPGDDPASVVARRDARSGTAYALWWAWHAATAAYDAPAEASRSNRRASSKMR
jgi:hypothetical protein